MYDKYSQNETHGGAYQGLMDEETELTFGAFFLDTSRSHQLTVISPVSHFRWAEFSSMKTFFSKKKFWFCSVYFYFRASTNEYFLFEIFKLFEYRVWIIQICLLLLTIIVCSIILKNEYSKLTTSLMTYFEIFCQQGVNMPINSASTRCLILALLFSSLMVYNYYTSGIVSVLVKNNYETKIKNKEDLAESSLAVGFSDSTHIKDLINVSLFWMIFSKLLNVIFSVNAWCWNGSVSW